VMVTTLADGTVPGRISYRAFGAVWSLTGNIDTPFRFNGYVSDGGDELSSPSRYYSVGTERFTSMDPAAPTQMDPMTWNAYVGMGANPMLHTDSTGRYWDLFMFAISEDRRARDTGAFVGAAEFVGEIAVSGAKMQGQMMCGLLCAADTAKDQYSQAHAVVDLATNHPYDLISGAVSTEVMGIQDGAQGDTYNAARPSNKLGLGFASAAAGAYDGARFAAGKIGTTMSQASAAAAQAGRTDAAFARQLDLDLARQGRIAEKI